MMPSNAVYQHLRALVDEALMEIGDRPLSYDVTPAKPLPTLLEWCHTLAAEAHGARPAIRLIDHFACTGGTLISKCVAALPNVRLFSEVEPHSAMFTGHATHEFAPTDLIRHLRYDLRGTSDQLVEAVFLAGLKEIYDSYRAEGATLVFRGHAHSIYCTAATPLRTLHAILLDHFPVRSLVTVRHPMESYLSAQKRGWLTYKPVGLDAYARRYHDFLDARADPAPLRYEDFVADPKTALAQICERLDLPYEPVVLDLFGAVRLTGDSGRSGDVIAPRSRKTPPEDVAAEALASHAYTELLARLGYAQET